ncbi:hypothetical protein Q1695_010097 [Nippostrongylus brasiliensis]|nr:hypothetical protein Q1695_010097 [Nippostrongylus brasiliensis]
MEKHHNHFIGNGRPNFAVPPPNVDMNAVNRMLAAQNNAIYNKHWNFNNLPLQQLRHASREDAILRDDLRKTRRRLSEMEKRIEGIEYHMRPDSKRSQDSSSQPSDSTVSTTTNRSQPSPDSTVHEPDLQAWLTQQRQNCELWNQNFALKEYLRCIEQENYMLREMCRQRDMQISALRKRTEELNADLKFNSDIKRDIKQVSNAFHFKPAKDVEAESFKCTCGQC